MYQTRGHKFGASHGSFAVRGPMTDDDIRRVAPSVFAAEKHDSRSQRFTYISTIDVLAGLRSEGFQVVAAIQGKSRTEGKENFTKHMLRLAHPDHALQTRMGGVRPEAILLNAHDGTSSYRLMSGLLRSICLNSMICWEDGAQDFRIGHTGDILGKVIEGTFSVINDSTRAIERAADWQGVTLNRDERLILAEAAHTLRFGEVEEGEQATPFQAAQLLQPVRREDVGDTLWQTHNVLQERVIRGGLHAVTRDATGRRRNVSTREINGIGQNVHLNRALWQLSARMAELKGVAA